MVFLAGVFIGLVEPCVLSSNPVPSIVRNPPMLAWYQTNIQLRPYPRGCHLITQAVMEAVPKIGSIRVGLLHVFLQHTSASLTLNENADPDVRTDFEMALNHLVPEDLDYVHTLEGPDDMPAHVKSSLMGASLSIPIRDGAMCLGTWQGIYLCEHRDRASRRSLVLTCMGDTDPASE